ncbi:S-layer homology domain-containing protein [Paenibacillus sp. NPDC057934]|uniref:S-layer homology domain-containing protein n=1 Tax=Paenibacillus sp. NPDC057934 TaxID=3346282 RepID=UPI0036DC3F23
MGQHFARKWKIIVFNWLLIVSMLTGMLEPVLGLGNKAEAAGTVASIPTDIAGHWAQQPLSEWVDQGLIKGFEDGTFRPNGIITRVEFVTLVNRLFAYKGTSDVTFKDVPADAWFASQVSAAVQAGYLKGFPDGTFQPGKSLSRVEAAVMVAKLVPLLLKEGENPLEAFKDKGSVPAYGRDPLAALLAAGYIKGFPDQTVGPGKPLTRAEAVVLLDRVMKPSATSADGGVIPAAKTLESGGTYGPATGTFTVAGDLTVNAPGTTLRNLVVKGNLVIGQKVGEGDVYLDHVTVLGKTSINGGGEHSVHIDDSQLQTVVVNRVDGRIRVVVGGTTVISQMDVQSDASVESNVAPSSSGIEGITISATGEVTLSGNFTLVEVKSNVKLTINSGTTSRIIVNEGVQSSTIILNKGVRVDHIEFHGTASVKGEGEILKALVDAPNVTFETKPGSVETTERGKSSSTPLPGAVAGGNGGGSGGGGGGGGGGTTPPTPTPPSNTTVEVTVTVPATTGFRLNFSTPITNLTAADFSLKDPKGRVLEVGFVGSLTGGSSYRVTANLNEGEIYSVALAKPGYDFGAPVTFSVPVTPPQDIAVTKMVQNISTTGFRVLFDKPVIGLQNSNFSLIRTGNGGRVTIGEVTPNSEGISYDVTVSLEEGVTYSLMVTKPGYSFGPAATIFVPVTDPGMISVTAEVYGISEDGFKVSFSPAVAGLDGSSFILLNKANQPVAISGATSSDDGISYTVAAALTKGETYGLLIEKSGYSFGAALAFAVPGEETTTVTPLAKNVRPYGFLLTMDKTLPELDALNFVLKNGRKESVSIDMLSAVVVGKEYEVWSTLDKADTYTLSLDKEGYAFTEPVVLKVEAEKLPSSVGWVTHSGFEIVFQNPISGLTAGDLKLEDNSGRSVQVDGIQFSADGKSAVVSGDLSTEGVYHYRLDTEDAWYFEGTVSVPAIVEINKHTTYEGFPGSYIGLKVHFALPVPGLTVAAFKLKDGSGNPIALDSVTSDDHGKSYLLQTSRLNSGGPFVLAVTAAGYSFGEPATLVSATLNVWNAGRQPTQFMAGLNPAVPGLTKDNFFAKDAAGNEVAITNVAWDSGQRMYIVTFAGSGGQSYTVSVKVSGYDFGAPKTIWVFAQNKIIEPSYTGFRLVLVPPVVINKEFGFKLTKSDGTPVAIQSVVMEDEGSSYRISANLQPDTYQLTVDAEMDSNIFTVKVPVLATVSVNQIASSGVNVKLNYALDGLSASNFVLVNTVTGDPVAIQSALTADQGSNYQLAANLPGGKYNLKLTGHLPAAGVDFQVAETIHAGATKVSNITNAGFDLSFENPVPGLLPSHISIKDAQNNKVSGLTLSTADNGATYHVRVALANNADYTMTLNKDFIVFDSPVTFHVNRFISASVADVTSDGHLTLKFTPAFPEIENYLGLSITDEAGTVYYPNLFESADGGATYQLYVPSRIQPGTAYQIKLNKDEFSMNPVTFITPPVLTVSEANVSGLKLRLDTPIPGLDKKHFIVKSDAGETLALTSAATDDAGATYLLQGTLESGRHYTVQYKSDLLYQINDPVPFTIVRTVKATISSVTASGFKLQFSSSVPGLTPQQVILRDPQGNVIQVLSSLKTTDQGLSYLAALDTVLPGKGYTLDLARDEFKLEAPVAFDIPVTAKVGLVSTAVNKIIVSVTPSLPGLTTDHFSLFDSKGKKIAIRVSNPGSGFYSIEGEFNPAELYTLQTVYPGYVFGAPLSIGFKLWVDGIIHAASTKGFRLALVPFVPNLSATDITVTDEAGNTVTVQSLQPVSAAVDYYNVSVPLSGGKTYQVTIADKAPYAFGKLDKIKLNSRTATVDGLSLKGFKLHMSSALNLGGPEVVLVDDQGGEVTIDSIVSRNAGLTYEIGATLKAGVHYSLGLNKPEYDFGASIPLLVQPVAATFEGMERGNNHAFMLRFDHAVPDMLPSEFKLQRDGIPVATASKVSTEDGGNTYKVEYDFRGTAQYTVLPVKDGYDFGKPVVVEVPVIVSSTVLNTGASYVDIGLNPAVPGLTASDFTLKDSTGQALTAASVVTEDGGATYRVKSSFIGGKTYTIALAKNGYDFGDAVSAVLPSVIKGEVGDIGDKEFTILLTPAVGGLQASSFILQNAGGQTVPLTSVKALNGGSGYTLSAALMAGDSYSVKLAAGYTLDAPLVLTMPVPIELTTENIHSEGLTVRLNRAVPGLSGGNFRLADAEGQTVSVITATTMDGGLTYTVRAALQYGGTYSVKMTKNGYDFGIGLPFTVLKRVTKSVTALSGNGFVLSLQTAVPDLKTSNVMLKDSTGESVIIDSLVTTDGGLTYEAVAKLTEGTVYTLSVTAQGYDFGPPVQLDVREMPVLSASDITTAGFNLNLSVAVPNLSYTKVYLTGADHQLIKLDSSRFYDPNQNTAKAGRTYTVRVPLVVGQTYILSINDPAHPTKGPVEVIVPVAVSAKVTKSAASGITLLLGQGKLDLQAADVEILSAGGDPVAVTGVAAGETAGTYTVQAALAEGNTYSLRLKKQGYDFGPAISVYVAYQVTAKLIGVNENGFTLSLNIPVPELGLTLLDAGTKVTISSASTADYGQTYQVKANLAYNKEFKLKLSKAGYEFENELVVNNISSPPQLLNAVSNESGTQVILTFDKLLESVIASSSFSVKIDGQWQSLVNAALGNDKTQIILTWNASGRGIGSTSTAWVAYTGVNRVKAVNQTYLPTFNDMPVTNVATIQGLVTSYAYKNDAAYPARVLHEQYGKTALETAQLLSNGGFKTANIYKTLVTEYMLSRSDLAPILYKLDADAITIFEAYDSIRRSDSAFGSELIGELIAAGYTTDTLGPALRKFGYSSKDLTGYLKYYKVPAAQTASILRTHYSETSGGTAALLQLARYDKKEIAGAVQAAYGLSSFDTVQALQEGQQTARDTASLIKDLYGADAITAATWLSQSGYPDHEVAGAIAEFYNFASAEEAIQAFLGAGFSVPYLYSMLRKKYPQPEGAVALLNAKIAPRTVAEAVQSTGDGAGVMISALVRKNYGVKEIAGIVNDLWVAAGVSLNDVMAQFASSGFDLSARAALLREEFGADIGTALGILYPNARNATMKYLLAAGYDHVSLTDYYLRHVYSGNRYEVFRQLRLAGQTATKSLQSIHDALIQAGEAFTLDDAMKLFFNDYTSRYEAADVLAAIRSVFAGDLQVKLDVETVATAMSNVQMWDKYAIGKALISQMGVTLEQWVELERTSAFARFGCACSVATVVKDVQYLFSKATLPDITVAMSMSKLYTLDLIIEGTINFYSTQGIRAKGMPYLLSALKNAGYAFEEVAAAFDSKGWSEWIMAFSSYGIAASDVTAYLKSTGLPMEQVVERLAPYPLKDRALVLREAYGLDSSAAMSVLLQHTQEDQEIIGWALAWAYGSDPITLWIQTLRSQGATATSVINTLAARYRTYWDSEMVGPALVQGGFSQEEVMKGLIVHSSNRNNLQATIALLQKLYGQQQVTIAQILKASAIESPAEGISFLQKGGYKLGDIARALKDYYGLEAGKATQLLVAAYPNSQNIILTGMASVYGQTLETTVFETLQAQGISNADEAIDYLRNAGFGIKEISVVVKEKFGLTAGQTAAGFLKKPVGDKNALITAVATAYNLPVETALYSLLQEQGVTSFAEAISFVFQNHFSLATSIKLAKAYGLSAGGALQAHLNSMLYRQGDVVAGVSDIYGSTQQSNIADSLKAGGMNTLDAAVPFLQKMRYDLEGIVRVGKEHYNLTPGETIAALMTEGSYDRPEIEGAVAKIYNQSLEQTKLESLSSLGISVFPDALPKLQQAGFTLTDLVLAAKTYYKLMAGETTYTLMQTQHYPAADILSIVAQEYGKPVQQSLDELLKASGIPSIAEAAPYLRTMGYTLQDVIEVSKNYYGNTSKATIEALMALHFEDGNVIEWTVLHVYGEDSQEAVGRSPQKVLQEAEITEEKAAVTYLWAAGFSLVEIADMFKKHYGKSSVETAGLLITNGSFSATAILNSLNTVYGSTYDAGLMNAFKTAGLFTSADAAALELSNGGYRLTYITEMLKKSYSKTRSEAKTILTALGLYSATAVQSAVEQVYDAVNTSSGTLQDVLDLYGITTAEGATAFLIKQNAPVQDILQYLKDAYNMGADQATEMLAPSYKGPELGLAVFKVYYNDANVGYLAKILPAGSASSPGSVASFMKGKFKDTDIVLALKVLFNLDELGVTDTVSTTVMSAERLRAAVREVFGRDPLFAYLKRMKERGANANDVAAELDIRGLLEPAPSSYLVNTLLALGYDNASVLKMRYNYYNDSRKNAGTEEEQGKQLVQLGVDTPAAIVQYLRKWNLLPYKVINIVKAGLPNAAMTDIALAMREQGYGTQAVMGGLDAVGQRGDDIAAILRKLGLSAVEALSFLSNRSSDDQLHWLIRNGYTPVEYIRYRNVGSDNTIAILKATGMSADDLAKLLSKNLNMGYYKIAKSLYDGGFKTIKEVAAALLAAGCRPGWVPMYLQEIAGWTLKEIAKAMLESNLITLTDLVTALQIANGNNLKYTFQIIKEVSTRERQAYYDGLNSAERKLLNNNEIALIVTASALRHANISLSKITDQLKNDGVYEPEIALKVLFLSGFNVLDATDTVWDAYRGVIGAMIILAMLKKAGGAYIADFSRYYTLISKVTKIVYELSK